MRKPASNCAADQRLCFRYTDNTMPLLLKSEISSLLPSSVAVQPVCVGPGRKPRRPVSHNEAHLVYLESVSTLPVDDYDERIYDSRRFDCPTIKSSRK